MTERAATLLKNATLVAAEDTRVSKVLLNHLGARPAMVPVHEHNEREAADKLLARLTAGEDVVLVSDAGTPGVSDPGARLVEALHREGVPVSPIPGPSAAVAAISVAGFTGPGFRFVGFLPPKRNARREAIAALAVDPVPQILFEAPHRVLECLSDLAEVLGEDREAVLCREITKTFETIKRLPLGELRDWVEADANQQRGEVVLVLAGAPAVERDEALDPAAEKALTVLLAELPVKQAVALAAQLTDAPRNALYQRALALKAEG